MTTHDPDPQRGDFDAELASLDPRDVQIVEHPGPVDVSVGITIRGDDVARLEQIARARGQRRDEVVAELIRQAAAAPRGAR